MPNTYVDMGYFGLQYMQSFGYSKSNAVERVYFSDLYSRLKTVMEAENGGLNWSFDRIFTWNDGADVGYGFVIKRLDGDAGSETGMEWLLWFTGARSNNVWSNGYSLWFDTASQTTHFMDAESASKSTFSRGTIGIHYHKGGLVTTYDVGAGDDFDPPATSPHTSAAAAIAFMPDIATYPHPRGSMFSNTKSDYSGRTCLVFNWEVPFLAMYHGYGNITSPRGLIVSGDIVIPRVSTDTYVEATVSAAILTPDDLYTRYSFSSENYDYVGGFVGHVLNPSGGKELVMGLYTDERNTNVSGFEYAENSTGDYDRFPIQLKADDPAYLAPYGGTTIDKGIIDLDVCCFQGAYDRQHQLTFPSAHGRGLVLSRQGLTGPWVPGAPTPFFGWPINPQSIKRF